MPTALHKQRIEEVLRGLRNCGAESVLDLGCGEGELLAELVDESQFQRIVALDSSVSVLQRARQRMDRLKGESDRVQVVHGSFARHDPGLEGFDAAVLLETIEHVEPHQLSKVERVVFRRLRPRTIFVTTPNSEYNAVYNMEAGELRHPDHRFEWARDKFEAWSKGVASRNGYEVTFAGIGDRHPRLGCPTQMGTFRRSAPLD